MPEGPIDVVQTQWRRERPDLDPSPLGVFGRIDRLFRLVDTRSKRLLRTFGMQPWEYALLATLRRSGPEYELTPSALADELLITSGALTNRIDHLERAGFVERRSHPDDRRALLVRLTEAGRAHIDPVVGAYFDHERDLLGTLTSREQRTLQGILRKLLISLDPPAGS